jgi:glycine hydroxymethyltransferase
MVPFDTESPFVTSGIRVGTAAITTRGLKENDIVQIVKWIDHVLSNVNDEHVINTVKTEINAKMKEYPLFQY